MNKIINENCLTGLKTLETGSVNCCITSPPYYNLRDYGMDEQIGLEETPEAFIAKLVEVFREVKRVLRNDGTLWVNIGDSYNGSGGQGTKPNILSESNNSAKGGKAIRLGNLKPKDLIGIPWMLAFALRADGWYLRQDLIWNKPNPMPESVTDRCTKAHEYIFLLSKSQKYYYDNEAIKEPLKYPNETRRPVGSKGAWQLDGREQGENGGGKPYEAYPEKANKRSVWTVTAKPFSEAHFATFSEELIVDCVKAGCPRDGLILDPFMGAGTTALVARSHNRNYIGFELNPEYIAIAEKRLGRELGMFA